MNSSIPHAHHLPRFPRHHPQFGPPGKEARGPIIHHDVNDHTQGIRETEWMPLFDQTWLPLVFGER